MFAVVLAAPLDIGQKFGYYFMTKIFSNSLPIHKKSNKKKRVSSRKKLLVFKEKLNYFVPLYVELTQNPKT